MTEDQNLPEKGTEEEPLAGEHVEEQSGGYIVRAEAVYMYQGPLPNAQEMERYEQMLEGSADRIMLMAEKEEYHRPVMDTRGQWIGAGLPVFFVVFGAGIFLMTGSWTGVVFAALGLTPAGFSFLREISRRSRQKGELALRKFPHALSSS